MKKYVSKFKTTEVSPKSASSKHSFYSGLGGMIAIGVVAYMTKEMDMPLIMAPFGATCVLAFGVPDSPLAQPRNIIGGHILSSIIGLLCLTFLGTQWYSLAIGVGASIGLMLLTKTTHPPAGADPLVIILAGASWSFLLNPVLTGSLIITLIALLFNNISKLRKYPKYWW
ncbi:HPP family protein [Myroides pelagicus]|uniref:HPP family protein n=1 Tax=Myroides pelagicus TaxID=270914 RepID=A0A7K1GPU7_9FLAO|nr:HPP family protein [Myroides pelagicus]MEC4114210.1 HPP family protein [Myroides pelagicus]MTH30876.1 HPP family protein [Myroides pelagicus]